MQMIEMPNKDVDMIDEAFRLGWESAISLKDMINAQSEQSAIDDLRNVAYTLYSDMLHGKSATAKEMVPIPTDYKSAVSIVVDPYPCEKCSLMTRSTCCGCPKEREWRERHPDGVKKQN